MRAHRFAPILVAAILLVALAAFATFTPSVFATTQVSITVTSNPAGSGYVSVDGTAIATPQTYTWNVGDSHTIAAVSPVSCGTGCEYIYKSWSDSGAQSHSITVPSSATTYTATFQLYYLLTVTHSTGGTTSFSSAWISAGTSAAITATPNSGYAFLGWTGAYTGYLNPCTVTMNSAIAEAASFAPGVQIIMTSSTAGSGYVTVDGVGITTPYAYAWQAGASHTLAANSLISCGTGCQIVFVSWTSTSIGAVTSTSFTYTAPSSAETVTANYKKQWQLTASYAVSGSGTPTAPTLSYTTSGSPQTLTVSTSATQAWADDGTAWSVSPNPLSGSTSSERWYSANAQSGTASAAAALLFTYYHQYLITLSWSWSFGGSPTGPILSTTQSGNPYTPTMSGGPGLYWADEGQPWAVTNPLQPSNSTQRWWSNLQTSGTVTSSFNIHYAFYEQFMLTMQASPGGAGTTTPLTSWQNATFVILTGFPASGYAFNSWTCTGPSCYAGTSNSAVFRLIGVTTETAIFSSSAVQTTITSSPAGSGYVTVDGSAVTTPQTYAWAVGSTHTIAAISPVSCGTGCQYIFTSWSDGGAQSHSVTVSSTTTVTANFKQQYYLTTSVSGGTGGTTSPNSGWYDAGTSVPLSVTADGSYIFESWAGSGTGSYTGTAGDSSVTMNGPITEQATFAIIIPENYLALTFLVPLILALFIIRRRRIWSSESTSK